MYQRVVCCFLLLFQEVEPEGVSPCPTYVLSPNSDCPLSDSSNSVSVGYGCLSSCIFYGYSLFLIPILFLLYCLTHNVLCIFRNILIIISLQSNVPKTKIRKKRITSIGQQSQYPVFPMRANKWYKVLATTI